MVGIDTNKAIKSSGWTQSDSNTAKNYSDKIQLWISNLRWGQYYIIG